MMLKVRDQLNQCNIFKALNRRVSHLSETLEDDRLQYLDKLEGIRHGLEDAEGLVEDFSPDTGGFAALTQVQTKALDVQWQAYSQIIELLEDLGNYFDSLLFAAQNKRDELKEQQQKEEVKAEEALAKAGITTTQATMAKPVVDILNQLREVSTVINSAPKDKRHCGEWVEAFKAEQEKMKQAQMNSLGLIQPQQQASWLQLTKGLK